MAYRIIEIWVADESLAKVLAVLGRHLAANGSQWILPVQDGGVVIKTITDIPDAGAVLDDLEKATATIKDLQVAVYACEAVLPRPEPPPENPEEDKPKQLFGGIGREELYTDVQDNTQLSASYLLLAVLAALVASIGLMRDNVAIIIGAMVLAPLLGPNVALSLASTLGDRRLARRAALTFGTGAGLSLVVAMFIGALFDVHPGIKEIATRTTLNVSDFVLALVSGAAGIIAVTRGAASSLVGVMVALSLLPPLATCGLLIPNGHYSEALGAGMLFTANVVCLNLSGVFSFLLVGVRPLSWWEKDRARRSTVRAVAVWMILLAVLSLAVWWQIAR